MDLAQLAIRVTLAAEDAEAGLEALARRFTALEETSRLTGNALTRSFSEGGEGIRSVSEGFGYLTASAGAWERQQQKLLSESHQLARAYEEGRRKLDTYQKGLDALQKAQKSGTKLTATESKALADLQKALGHTGSNWKQLSALTQAAANTLRGEMLGMGATARSLAGEFGELQASAKVRGDVQVDTSGAQAALAALLAIAQTVQGVLSALGVLSGGGSKKGGGGGGGGGKKNDAAAAARAAEQARKDAIQKDYDLIAHKRHMNQITLEMELSMLETVRRKHRLNAEEIMAWEEKIYDVKKEIRARDAESIDKTGDALLVALEARYQKMLDAELQRLDTGREAWSAWRDESVKAIEDQIAALEALSKTEDREKQEREELRKIAKLRQDIAFEQDAYSRMKLEQQLSQAIGAREERLARQERDDQKDALRADIAAIQARTDAEISALDKTRQEIEKAYEEQMKSAALRAEAEKMIMTGSQEDMIRLIGEFAPDYNALGQTLGEKLLDGFTAKAGDVVKWFQNLNQTLAGIQEAAAAEAIAAAGQLQSGYALRQGEGAAIAPTIVEQTNNFNMPVETPGEIARRVQQANEDLGALLAGGI